MSINALKVLKAIGLLDNDNKPCDLTRIPDDQLSSLLSYYYDERTRTFSGELKLLRQQNAFSGLVSSISAANAVLTLLPSFLVYGHLITDDPLYRISVPEQEISKGHKQAMGVVRKSIIDRSIISNKLEYFALLAPLIEGGLLAVLPLYNLHLPPKALPLFSSEDRFRSEVPDHIHDFVHSKAVVRPVVLNKDTGALIIPRDSYAKMSRAICISFQDDHERSSNLYFYQEMRKIGHDPTSGDMQVSLEWKPDVPLSQDIYDVWVEQSINRTIIQRLRSVASEFYLAQDLGHIYITESAFESQLLGQSGEKSHPMRTAIEFLQANESIIPIESPQQVLAVRQNNSELFERFRAQLLSVSEQLHGLEGGEFNEKAKRLFNTEIQPQIDEITKATQSITTSTIKGGLVALGGVALAIISGSVVPLVPALLYGTASSLTETYSSVSEYMHKRKQPEYIWSKLKAK